MLKRIITALVAICVLLPILIFSDTLVFPIAAVIFTAIAVFEMLRCCNLHKRLGITIVMLLASAYPFYGYFERDRAAFAATGLAVLLLLVLYLFTYLVFMRGQLALHEVGIPFLTCFYIIAAFSSLVMLRYDGEYGKYIYLVAFFGAWITDIFAYFVGRLLGKHKLIVEISPKKTVEGAIGGVVFCVLSMLLYGWIISALTDGGLQANYLLLAISGVFISFVSQVGDLAMSAVKRAYGIKDYGKLFPGHGGVLDRFDSVLAVSLVLALLTSLGELFIIV